MEKRDTSTAMSSSLLARDVYCVCFPERDGLDSLHGELSQARKQYFAGGKKPVRSGGSEIVKGVDGKLQGKLSRRSFFWKKTAGKVSLEEAFDQKNGHVLVKRDFRGVIVSRTFFDQDHRWIRSEYYEPWDSIRARVTFRPSDAADRIERFDKDPNGSFSRSTELFPLPYLDGTAEQSMVNARFGEPRLILSTGEGDFCYCPKREAEARKQALEQVKHGVSGGVLTPAWEIRDGALAGDEGEEETRITFTSLEEYARIEPPQPEDEPPEEAGPGETEPSPPADRPEEEFTPAPEPETGAEPSEDELILAVAREAARREEPPVLKESGSGMGYRGDIRDGKITGRGRTEQSNGMTAYDGEYLDGKRDGFGSYYYKDGSLCYAGFWRDDKRDGLGVSFRETDHALHVAKWENGSPDGFVCLFDTNGNLRYGGRIENGQKQGVGMSFNREDGTVFVGKWEDGKPTDLGAAFDRDGSLLYSGYWKDGKRNGHGTEFGKNGVVVFDGEWKDGKYHNGILYQKMPQEGMDDGDAPSWDL